MAASFRPLEPFRSKSAISIPPKPPRERTLRPPTGRLASSKLILQTAFYPKGAPRAGSLGPCRGPNGSVWTSRGRYPRHVRAV